MDEGGTRAVQLGALLGHMVALKGSIIIMSTYIPHVGWVKLDEGGTRAVQLEALRGIW